MKKDKVIFLYKDYNSRGGVPSDLENFIRFSLNHYDANVIGWGKNFISLRSNGSHFKSIFDVIRYLQSQNRDARIVFVGGMIFDNSIGASILMMNKVAFEFMPLSHWTDWSLKHKIFEKYPDIKTGEFQSAQLFSKLLFKLKSFILVPIKNIFFFIFKMVYRKASIYWVASKWEANQIKISLNKKYINYVIYRFGSDILQIKDEKYFDNFQDNINLVFWGRIDFYNKGFDRLIKLIKTNKDELHKRKVLFHMLGPDYNNGLEKLYKELKLNSIEKFFLIPSDEILSRISIGGLAHSDGMVLLSMFEGHPRSIREAVFFNVPVLSSLETHGQSFIYENIINLDFLDKEKLNESFLKFIDLAIKNKTLRKGFIYNHTWASLSKNNKLIEEIVLENINE
tara:strand:+ start:13388 stop:14575 length:1188 start_codon:yes stop_codon:yes gene_type:complete